MTETIKLKIRRLYDEACNKGNVDALEEMIDPTYARHQPPMKSVHGVDGYKAFLKDVRSAYTGYQITIEDILVEGDKSCVCYTLKGKHTGQAPTLQAAPTGKQIEMKACAVSTWKDGKIIEEWVYNDYYGLLLQFGVIPLPGRVG